MAEVMKTLDASFCGKTGWLRITSLFLKSVAFQFDFASSISSGDIFLSSDYKNNCKNKKNLKVYRSIQLTGSFSLVGWDLELEAPLSPPFRSLAVSCWRETIPFGINPSMLTPLDP